MKNLLVVIPDLYVIFEAAVFFLLLRGVVGCVVRKGSGRYRGSQLHVVVSTINDTFHLFLAYYGEVKASV